MDKISISDFCGEEKTYAQLIQDLYFHISVKELYMVLASNAAQNRDVYESVSYRNTYSSLENRIPDVCRMTVGELLRYATEKCLSGRNIEEFCMLCCWTAPRFQRITDGRMKKGIFT